MADRLGTAHPRHDRPARRAAGRRAGLAATAWPTCTPASRPRPATRTLAQLAGLAGRCPPALLLGGAAVAAVQARSAIGTPQSAMLAGGLLLVIAAGAAGVAIGTRFPHPLAGVLGAMVLLFSSVTSHLASGAAIWLVPWEMEPDQLANLPGPLAGYPPSGAHAAELAGLAVLAGILALAVTVRHARARARAGGGRHRRRGRDLPRRGAASAAHPHRRPEPPGKRGRQPGLGAALHHGRPGPVLPLPGLRIRVAAAGGVGRRSARAAARATGPAADDQAGHIAVPAR